MFKFTNGHFLAGVVASTMFITGTSAGAQSANEPVLTIDGLSGGTVVEAPQRQVGETYIKETFSAWSLRCIVAAQGEDPCQMYQLLEDGQGQPIAEFTMFRLPEGSEAIAGATIVVPLETALERGVTVQVDDNPAKLYPFAFCNSVGCYARIAMTEEEIGFFKAGADAVVMIIPIAAPDRQVRINASLSGFTAAFEASSVIAP